MKIASLNSGLHFLKAFISNSSEAFTKETSVCIFETEGLLKTFLMSSLGNFSFKISFIKSLILSSIS